MSGDGEERRDPRARDVLLLGMGAAGLAMCITLMFYGMRSVMDVGGACADGGPFVPAQSCPQGSPAALILGMFGWFGFGALTFAGGALVGGAWAGAGILAWTGLFAALGWNFLDYGLFNPPDGEVVWGWLIPGIMFQVMAFAPLVIGGSIVGSMRGRSAEAGVRERRRGPARAGDTEPAVIEMPGPGQRAPGWREPGDAAGGTPRTAAFTTVTVDGKPLDDEAAREALAGVAAAFDAAGIRALAGTPIGEILDEAADRAVDGAGSAPAGETGSGPMTDDPSDAASFTEGTQALLDRLERLADMRAQGLLDEGEYETAKDAVLRELEARKQV